MARAALRKKLRFDVFKRDGFTCVYCGAQPPSVVLECDHIHPVSKGGKDEIENLITSCQDCNRGKGAGLLSDMPKSVAERAAEVREREEQIIEFNALLKERRERIEEEAYEVLDQMCETYDRDSIPRADFLSIKRFLEHLVLDDLMEAQEIAARRFRFSYKQHFKYFCGVCWRRIKRANGEETHEQ